MTSRKDFTVDLSLADTEAAVTLLRAWDKWRGSDLMPTRRQVHLPDLRSVLDRIILLDHCSDDEVLFRVAGTALCATVEQELRGQNYVHFAPPETRPLRALRLRHVVQRPCGSLAQNEMTASSGLTFRVEGLLLPVRPDTEGAPMQIIGVVDSLPGEPAPARAPDRAIGDVAERFRFLDIGAGVPDDASLQRW